MNEAETNAVKAAAADDYARATQWCNGYIEESRRQMVAAEKKHDTSDGYAGDIWAARMRGRIEAIANFDRKVLDYMTERRFIREAEEQGVDAVFTDLDPGPRTDIDDEPVDGDGWDD